MAQLGERFSRRMLATTGMGTIAFSLVLLGQLRGRLAERRLTLNLTDAAREHIGREGYDPVYGARPLKRVIQQRIENPLASSILAGEFAPGDGIRTDFNGGRFTFAKA
jgi:ATP-dependent Clp protease ATP-binding subunit ClpB